MIQAIRILRTLVVSLLWIALPLSGCYVLLVGIGAIPGPDACITEKLMKIYGLSGLDFEVSEMDCDTLAKDEAVSIFVSEPGVKGRTLLIKYGPGKFRLPAITVSGERQLRISLTDASSIYCLRDRWNEWSITCTIDTIYYPSPIDRCD